MEPWTSIRAMAGKSFSEKTISKFVQLLLAEHKQALVFRRNLNTLCCVSDAAKQHRDKQRLQQCRDIADMLVQQVNKPPPWVQLHTTLNSCEFLLDVFANNRHGELGLSAKAIEDTVKQVIRQLFGPK